MTLVPLQQNPVKEVSTKVPDWLPEITAEKSVNTVKTASRCEGNDESGQSKTFTRKHKAIQVEELRTLT